MVASIISPNRYSLVPYSLLSGFIRIGCQAGIDFESGDSIDRVEFVLTPASGPAVTQTASGTRTWQVPGFYDGGHDGPTSWPNESPRGEAVCDWNVEFDLNAVVDGAATIVATIYTVNGLSKTLSAYEFTNNTFGTIIPQDIYVSQSGSDSTGTGTRANPFATAGKALGIASPGDTVWIGKGDGQRRDWMAEAWGTGTASGSADVWISFDAYDDSANPEENGDRPTIEWTVDFGTIPRTTTGGTTPGPNGHNRWRFRPGIKFYEIRITANGSSSWWVDGCEWYTRGRTLGFQNSNLAGTGAVDAVASTKSFQLQRPTFVGSGVYVPEDWNHAPAVGETIDISTTTSNNGTFTVAEVDGSFIYVEEAVVDEFDASTTVSVSAYQKFGIDTGRVLDDEVFITGAYIHHFGEWNDQARLGRGNSFSDFAGDSPMKSSSSADTLWYNTRIWNGAQGPGNHGDILQTNGDGTALSDHWIQGLRILDSMHALIQTSHTTGSNPLNGYVLENVVHVNSNSGHYTQSESYGPVLTNANWSLPMTNTIISHCTFINQDMRLNPVGWANARVYNCIIQGLKSFGQTQTEMDAADVTFYGVVLRSIADFTALPGGGTTANRIGTALPFNFVQDSLDEVRSRRDFRVQPGGAGYQFAVSTQLSPPSPANSGAWDNAARNRWNSTQWTIPRHTGGSGASATSPSRMAAKRSPGWTR